MAYNDFVQNIVNADIDAQALSAFMQQPSGNKVPRRLAAQINTLDYYLGFLRGLELVYSQQSGEVDVNGVKVKTVTQAIKDAIYNAGVANGVNANLVVYNNRTQAAKNADLLSIKDFGAIGDGTLHKVSEKFNTLAQAQAYYPSCETLNDSIDRLAIQKSLDEVGYAYIPQGTYIINVRQDKKYFIKVGANQRVFGDGAKSLLKVADNNGDYFAIFYQDVSVSVDNATLTNFAIHQNVTGNSTSVVTSNFNKFAICLYKFSNVKVSSLKIYEACGTNTITLNAKFASGAVVHDCDIFWKQNNPVHYDNSAFYISCDNHWVYNNRFYGVIGESWGAIESHGSNGMVYDNKSFNYGTLCNLVNYSNADEYNLNKSTKTKVFDNVAINCFAGIRLWATTAGVALNSNQVHDNDIYVAHVQWFKASGIVMAKGICTEYSTSKDANANFLIGGLISKASIKRNNIEFEQDPNNEYTTYSTANAGISIIHVGTVDKLQIKNNDIINSPFHGIFISQHTETSFKNTIKNIVCTDNTLIDCGCNSTLPIYRRTAIFLGGKIDNSLIDNNTIKDTGATQLNGYYSVFASSTEALTDTIIGKQKVQTVAKNKMHYQISVPNYSQTSTPKIISTASYPPPDGTTVFEGDIVIITGTVDMGQPMAYQCTSMGTFGALSSGVTASMTANSNGIVINGLSDASTIIAVDKAGTDNIFPNVGYFNYLSGSIGYLSKAAKFTVTDAAVSYWQPVMKPINYKTGSASMTYNLPSLAAGAQQSPPTFAVPGALMGNNVVVSFNQPLQGTRLWAEVTAANTVTVYHRNDTGAVVDLPSGTLTVKII